MRQLSTEGVRKVRAYHERVVKGLKEFPEPTAAPLKRSEMLAFNEARRQLKSIVQPFGQTVACPEECSHFARRILYPAGRDFALTVTQFSSISFFNLERLISCRFSDRKTSRRFLLEASSTSNS